MQGPPAARAAISFSASSRPVSASVPTRRTRLKLLDSDEEDDDDDDDGSGGSNATLRFRFTQPDPAEWRSRVIFRQAVLPIRGDPCKVERPAGK
jgi:hypothetical protein